MAREFCLTLKALAALLLDELELVPLARGDKAVLDRDDNADLSQWQRDKLRLTWCVRPGPWEIEDDVIKLMQPPLNSAANASHTFYPGVQAARAEVQATGEIAAGRRSQLREHARAEEIKQVVEADDLIATTIRRLLACAPGLGHPPS